MPPFALIAGVGAGTGASVARKFALSYPVVLLSRNPSNYNDIVSEINSKGGKALGVSCDVSDEKSVAGMVEKCKEFAGTAGEMKVAAAVYNVGGRFVRKPFLELTTEEFGEGWEANGKGAFLFSRAILPFLVAPADRKYPPTLIFTGATASLKGSARMSSFATGKFAMRALAQSLAREFGPQGVHVAHAVIDGVIDIPRTKEWKLKGLGDEKISSEAIADAYWHLHTQPRSTFTNEIDIRPYCETW